MLIQVRASSQTKGLERGWKQRARQGRDLGETGVWGSRASLTPRFRDFFTDFKKKNPTVLQYITVVPAFAMMWPALTWETERERKRPSLKCFAVLCMICTVNPKRSSPSVYIIPQWNFAPIYRISFLIKTGMTCAAKEISFRHQVNPKYIEKHMEEVSEWKSFQYLIIRWMDVSCCIPPLNNIIIIIIIGWAKSSRL